MTMNEPQLSAEMEIVTKFRQFLANWDYAHLTRKVSVEESRQMCDEFALTLATALEEQRKEILSEVDEAITKRVLPAPLYGNYKEDRLHQRWQAELNQLKGKK